MAEPEKTDPGKTDEAKASKERKAFLLRLPPELHEELRRWASQDLRSLNGQIEYLLRQSVARRKGRDKA